MEKTIFQLITDKLNSIEKKLLGQKTVLTFEEIIPYTGLSKSYLYKLTCSGEIPHYKPNGKHIYFNKSEIDNWLLRNRVKTNAEIEQEAINYTTSKKH